MGILQVFASQLIIGLQFVGEDDCYAVGKLGVYVLEVFGLDDLAGPEGFVFFENFW
jgi:hypothetical protein